MLRLRMLKGLIDGQVKSLDHNKKYFPSSVTTNDPQLFLVIDGVLTPWDLDKINLVYEPYLDVQRTISKD